MAVDQGGAGSEQVNERGVTTSARTEHEHPRRLCSQGGRLALVQVTPFPRGSAKALGHDTQQTARTKATVLPSCATVGFDSTQAKGTVTTCRLPWVAIVTGGGRPTRPMKPTSVVALWRQWECITARHGAGSAACMFTVCRVVLGCVALRLAPWRRLPGGVRMLGKIIGAR